MDSQRLFARYQELQRYVGWSEEDSVRIRAATRLVAPSFPAIVDDFYAEIERHPEAAAVITGGEAQIQRLKGTLVRWLEQLFEGPYDADYVFRRWKIGYKHVEIGLDQVYTNVALSRLRRRLLTALDKEADKLPFSHVEIRTSLNTLIDLDLALIEDAYATEYILRRQATERLVLIGQVAGGIAHELRNPLNVVKTSVFYLLNAKSLSPDKTKTHLERIERHVGLAEEVIASLVRFARMPLPELQPVEVATLIQDAIVSTDRPANIEVVQKIAPGLQQAVADASQIRIVLDNLIRNACEAMPDGGRVTLSAAFQRPYIEIQVSDNGPGIDPEKLQRVMEPFYSTKSRGVGLGLAMAKAIVEKNNGRIAVSSQPGQGASFTVRLKASLEPS